MTDPTTAQIEALMASWRAEADYADDSITWQPYADQLEETVAVLGIDVFDECCRYTVSSRWSPDDFASYCDDPAVARKVLAEVLKPTA